jgi:hypothetical protein
MRQNYIALWPSFYTILPVAAIKNPSRDIIPLKERSESRLHDDIPSWEDLDGGEILPLSYGEDQLVLLTRDPYWLFAYWEFNEETKKDVEKTTRKPWGELEFALRVHRFNKGNKKESYYDIKIDPSALNWYIQVGVPDKQYKVDLGYYPPGKGFVPVLTSNLASTPRDNLSDIIDDKWRLPDWQARRLFWRIARSSLSSMEMMLHREKHYREVKRKGGLPVD